MKKLGYLLITGGFLSGAYAAVRDPEAVALVPFLVAFFGGGLGVALVRVALHKASRHEEKLAANLGTLGDKLERLAENAERLEHEKGRIDVYDLRHKIEDVFADDLNAFVEARESIAHRYGLEAYAEVMSHFAAGERHLNRVWSTSTDGYIDEAHTYVARAAEQLREAQQSFSKLTATAA